MKSLFVLFCATTMILVSCNNDSNNDQENFEFDNTYASNQQNEGEYMAHDGSYKTEGMSPAKHMYGNDSQNETMYLKQNEGNILRHAELDSDLILNNYADKRFSKDIVGKNPEKKTKKTTPTKKSIGSKLKKFNDKKISINITEDVDVKDAIMEVSRLAGIDVEIDPDVEGSVILSLTSTKVSDILERIAELADLNVTVRNNVVRFNASKSYTENYSVSFLEAGQNNRGNNSNSTSGIASVAGNQNNNNNSNNQLPTTNLYNNGGIQPTSMWEQFESGLKYIVSQKKGVEYSINKQAGIVTLNATASVHKDVEKYVAKIKRMATTQILVEVRLVEVGLEDEFSAGIDFGHASSNFSIKNTYSPARSATTVSGNPFVATLKPNNPLVGLSAAIEFLQTFGTTKTISSPRLNVMNNQHARLSFAYDYVYFSLQPQIQNQFAVAGTSLSNPNTPIIVQSQLKTVPVGVILSLQATADLETKEITMNINPVLTSVKETVTDPTTSFLSGVNGLASGTNITNTIPVIEKKELNSTLRIKSGDIMVIGGFNEEKTIKRTIGLPVLKNIPWIRYLFGAESKFVRNFETVIFIKATIIDPEGDALLEEDKKFFNDYA